ncbi:MAG: hypothetical protein ACP5VE_14890 [Chthonomonadales bacterium]
MTIKAHANDDASSRWWQALANRRSYSKALDRVAKAHGGRYELPRGNFFLFGMGPREKFAYTGGKLIKAATGEVVYAWTLGDEVIAPAEYTVAIRSRDARYAFIWEDEEALWLQDRGQKHAIAKGSVRLPEFAGHRHRLLLRVLHQEMLVNVLHGKPLPNFFVYERPWYRDAAMMAMAFEKTGNLPVIAEWILSLQEPFDRNNKNETEPDNLGECLYLVSLVSDLSHPLVPKVFREMDKFKKNRYLEGRTDFAAHPVYQTKWAKYGLKSLGLTDPYIVPKVQDSYAALFWWAYKDDDLPGQPLPADPRYPYLGWASSHYAGNKAGKLSDRDYPLTWEADASEADYRGMARVAPEFAAKRTCSPHAWHAAEAFLYLLEEGD